MSSAQYPEYDVQNPSAIDTRHAARLVRQPRLDYSPLKLGRLIAAQPSSPLTTLNQKYNALGAPFMILQPKIRVSIFRGINNMKSL